MVTEEIFLTQEVAVDLPAAVVDEAIHQLATKDVIAIEDSVLVR